MLARAHAITNPTGAPVPLQSKEGA
jgi:hypothetical protein